MRQPRQHQAPSVGASLALLAAALSIGCALGAGIEIPSSSTGPDDDTGNESSDGLAVDPPPLGSMPGQSTGGGPCCIQPNVGGLSGAGLGGAAP